MHGRSIGSRIRALLFLLLIGLLVIGCTAAPQAGAPAEPAAEGEATTAPAGPGSGL
jgi:hypothetical protein